MTACRAAIDVGSNSVKLCVVDGDGTRLERSLVVTRLSEGLAGSGRLDPDRILTTAATVGKLATRARELGADSIIVAGTEACRRATNVHLLVEAIDRDAGLPLRVLTGPEEARLGFVGAIGGLGPAEGPTLVVDIGGASTEISVGIDSPEHVFSVPHGAVSLTESHLHHDPPRPEELTNAIGEVQDDMEEVLRAVPGITEVVRHVGIAGTIVTVAAVELGLATFDENVIHSMLLTRDAAEDVFRTLATEALADRIHNPGLPRDRADIIVGGCCALVAVMRRLQLDGLTVSTRGLVDALCAEAALS
jgi:exopolyphosphatase/guanosine-5'-triphosphate,3'-diphosphate pyrophosphatase